MGKKSYSKVVGVALDPNCSFISDAETTWRQLAPQWEQAHAAELNKEKLYTGAAYLTWKKEEYFKSISITTSILSLLVDLWKLRRRTRIIVPFFLGKLDLQVWNSDMFEVSNYNRQQTQNKCFYFSYSFHRHRHPSNFFPLSQQESMHLVRFWKQNLNITANDVFVQHLMHHICPGSIHSVVDISVLFLNS